MWRLLPKWSQGASLFGSREVDEWPTRNRSPDRVGTSSDRPLHAERIRRSWEAGKCMAVGPAVRLVVRPGRVVEPEPHRSEDRPLHGEPDPSAVRVWGRAGSGSCGCRTFLSFCCKRVQVMEGERFIISDKWEGTESVVEGFSPKNPDLPWRRPRCNIAKFVLV